MILVYFSEYEKTILPPPKRISTSETYYTSKLIVFPNCQFLILSNVRLGVITHHFDKQAVDMTNNDDKQSVDNEMSNLLVLK